MRRRPLLAAFLAAALAVGPSAMGSEPETTRARARTPAVDREPVRSAARKRDLLHTPFVAELEDGGERIRILRDRRHPAVSREELASLRAAPVAVAPDGGWKTALAAAVPEAARKTLPAAGRTDGFDVTVTAESGLLLRGKPVKLADLAAGLEALGCPKDRAVPLRTPDGAITEASGVVIGALGRGGYPHVLLLPIE